MKKILLTTLLLVTSIKSFAQRNFEGKIISIERTPQGNKENLLFIKNDKIQIETEKVDNVFNLDGRIIIDISKANLKMVFDNDAKFCNVDINKSLEKSKDDWKNAQINITGNTKKIAGYNCQEVEVFMPDKTAILWISNEVKYDNFKEFVQKYNTSLNNELKKNNLDGLTLSNTVKDSKGTVTQEVIYTSIVEEKVDDIKFTIPKNYGETNMEDYFKKTFEEAMKKAEEDKKNNEKNTKKDTKNK